MNELSIPQGRTLVTHQHVSLPAGIEASDLEPSRLMLQQKMSGLVDQNKARPGDIVDSVTGTVLGGEGKPVELLPLAVKKVWVSYWIDGNDKKFRLFQPYGPQNANWQYEAVVDDKPVKNDLQMVWSVLPLGIESMPSLVTFKSMSFKTGKKLATIVAQGSVSGKKPYEKSILLSSVKQTSDKGSYYTFDVAPGKAATEEQMETARFWYEVMSQKTVDIKEEEISFP